MAVTGDATYKATFKAVKNKYLIIFQNEDGSELKRDSVEYGEMPKKPKDPTKPRTDEYTYTFAGWTPEVVAVTGDAIYTATYTENAIMHTLTLVVNDSQMGYISGAENGEYKHGTEFTITAVPNPGYKFISWEMTRLFLQNVLSHSQAT